MAQPGVAGPEMNSSEAAIRHQLDSYLSRRMSLEEFTAWLVGATWNIEIVGEAGASQLVYVIELALAEHSSGLLTLEELWSVLRGFSREELLNPITR